jgi:hypothetical protein
MLIVFSLVIHLNAKERKIGGNEQNLEIARVSCQNIETYSSVFSVSEQGKHVLKLPHFAACFCFIVEVRNNDSSNNYFSTKLPLLLVCMHPLYFIFQFHAQLFGAVQCVVYLLFKMILDIT